MTRRIVTGINADGKSYFVHNGPTPGSLDAGMYVIEDIWIDDPAKPESAASIEPVDVDKFELLPPLNGSHALIATVPPNSVTPKITPESLAENFGDAMEADKPGTHTTPTIDYVIVISGELYLELD